MSFLHTDHDLAEHFLSEAARLLDINGRTSKLYQLSDIRALEAKRERWRMRPVLIHIQASLRLDVGSVEQNLLLKAEATEAWEHHLRHQPTRTQTAGVRDEFLRGRKRSGMPTGRANQLLEAFTHPDVIIDNIRDEIPSRS